MNVKNIVDLILPPTVKILIRGLLSRLIGFVEVKSWAQAQSAVAGYESDTAIESIIKSIESSRIEGAGKNVLSSRDLQIISSFAIAVAAVSISKKTIRVIDVGGAGGDYFYMFAGTMPAVKFDWVVVETPALAAAISQAHLEHGEGIRWVSSVAEAGDHFDVALMSSVMQYVESPYALLREVAEITQTIVINRIPLIESAADQVTVQRVRSHGRRGAYPAWFFSETIFFAEIQQVGTIVSHWPVPEDSHVLNYHQITSQGLVVLTNQQR